MNPDYKGQTAPNRSTDNDRDSIPQILKQFNQWVCWRAETDPTHPNKKPRKMPITVTGSPASSTDPSTWASFEEACDAARRLNATGVGFVFTADDPFVGIDLDDCRDPKTGEIAPWAMRIIQNLKSYAEISPSKRGIKIFATGKKPPAGIKRAGDQIPKEVKPVGVSGGIEIYGKARYFVVTGEHLLGTPTTIEDAGENLASLIEVLRGTEPVTQPIHPSIHHPPVPNHDHARRWAEERLQTAEKMLADAPAGMRHNIRLAAAKLAGGVVAHGFITAEEAAARLFAARPPGAHAATEIKAIRDGITAGIAEPLPLPNFPTTHPIIDGCCPSCGTPVQRSKFDYPGTTTPGWYCPSCKGQMVWPLEAYSPQADASGVVWRRDGDIPAPTEPLGLWTDTKDLSDLGNARRMAALFGDELGYIEERGEWVRWGGTHWQRQTDGDVQALAIKVVDKMRAEVGTVPVSELVPCARWAKTSRSRARLDGMLALARTILRMPAATFDTNPYLLSVKNGTLDLRNGDLRPHRKEDGITRYLDIPYMPDAPAPRWHRFIDEVTRGDRDLTSFLQAAVGYSLTGDVSEQCLFFLHGGGRNGKSTFIRVLKALAGDYSITIPADALMLRDRGGRAWELAELPGKRITLLSEIEDGVRLQEGLVKSLTGGDAISVERKYGHPFTFTPQHKFWLAGNQKPAIRGTDEGIWRRIRLIPFHADFRGREEPHLLDTLYTELSGILAWAVRGAVWWYAERLPASQTVAEATENYRAESDVVGQFLAECCIVTPNAQASASLLLDAFNDWSGRHMSHRVFNAEMQKRGLVSKHTKMGRVYSGVGLLRSAPPGGDGL